MKYSDSIFHPIQWKIYQIETKYFKFPFISFNFVWKVAWCKMSVRVIVQCYIWPPYLNMYGVQCTVLYLASIPKNLQCTVYKDIAGLNT